MAWPRCPPWIQPSSLPPRDSASAALPRRQRRTPSTAPATNRGSRRRPECSREGRARPAGARPGTSRRRQRQMQMKPWARRRTTKSSSRVTAIYTMRRPRCSSSVALCSPSCGKASSSQVPSCASCNLGGRHPRLPPRRPPTPSRPPQPRQWRLRRLTRQPGLPRASPGSTLTLLPLAGPIEPTSSSRCARRLRCESSRRHAAARPLARPLVGAPSVGEGARTCNGKALPM